MSELKGIGGIEGKVGGSASKGDILRKGGDIFSSLRHPQVLVRKLGSCDSHRY